MSEHLQLQFVQEVDKQAKSIRKQLISFSQEINFL